MLERLRWAQRVLIIDSFSTDSTLEIVREFPNTCVIQRDFDHFADQCNFGLKHVSTVWTLSLDADYICPEFLSEEIRELSEECGGYRSTFRYCVYGSPLRATLYPPRLVLYRTAAACYVRDGHAHKVVVSGQERTLRCVIDHDDRKPLGRWLESQSAYVSLEADKLTAPDSGPLGWKDRLRLQIAFAPFLTAVYCLFWRLLILDGRAGLFYTLQRVYAELLLSLELLDRKLKREE